MWKFFKHLVVTVTNTNDIREEIKRRINIGNTYYSLGKILSSNQLSKKLKVNANKTIRPILLVVLY